MKWMVAAGNVQKLVGFGGHRYDRSGDVDLGVVNPLGIAIGRDGHASGVAGVDVMEISRPDGASNIADLGLTLSEAKQLLARVQQAIVAAQAGDLAARRPESPSCT